ncbi:Hypothetical predicted protein [Xyrichtys novacula]|uniref:Uncharacterized protein n=1 Tax=Xyrichtys novacula TaxID=13765 RepID=A0AAV1G1V0_XYRNO|nr:Hypothetical predicted protein [Xyrichtys novacula]
MCPLTLTGVGRLNIGLSSSAPPGTLVLLATTSPSSEAAPTSPLPPGLGGTPTSAHCASSSLLSRHAPIARPVAPTWPGSARTADQDRPPHPLQISQFESSRVQMPHNHQYELNSDITFLFLYLHRANTLLL